MNGSEFDSLSHTHKHTHPVVLSRKFLLYHSSFLSAFLSYNGTDTLAHSQNSVHHIKENFHTRIFFIVDLVSLLLPLLYCQQFRLILEQSTQIIYVKLIFKCRHRRHHSECIKCVSFCDQWNKNSSNVLDMLLLDSAHMDSHVKCCAWNECLFHSHWVLKCTQE